MIKRKLTIRPKKEDSLLLHTPHSKRRGVNRVVSKDQEDAYWESRKRERDEKFVNDYYQENKYKLVPVLLIAVIISYPFVKIGEIYKYCTKSCSQIHPENNN